MTVATATDSGQGVVYRFREALFPAVRGAKSSSSKGLWFSGRAHRLKLKVSPAQGQTEKTLASSSRATLKFWFLTVRARPSAVKSECATVFRSLQH